MVANTAGEGNVSIFDSFGLFSPTVTPADNKDEKILSERLQQAEILLENQETVTHHTSESLIRSLRLLQWFLALTNTEMLNIYKILLNCIQELLNSSIISFHLSIGYLF